VFSWPLADVVAAPGRDLAVVDEVVQGVLDVKGAALQKLSIREASFVKGRARQAWEAYRLLRSGHGLDVTSAMAPVLSAVTSGKPELPRRAWLPA
jgi:hypothetical protein